MTLSITMKRVSFIFPMIVFSLFKKIWELSQHNHLILVFSAPHREKLETLVNSQKESTACHQC